jgi:SAM-dependent methyltransferase
LSTSAPPRRPALAVAGLSASIFLLEVLLTRIFSVTLFHHFAFAAISMGMLGLAAAGVRVALAPARFSAPRADADVAAAATLFGLTTLAALLVLVRLGVYPVFSWDRVARIALIYAVCFVPFYFGGLGLSLIFAHERERFGRLYACDLAAAGLAGLLVFPVLRALGAPAAVVAGATLASLAALAAYPALAAPRRAAAWSVVVLAALLVAGDGAWGWLRLRDPKQAGERRVLFEAWNALSRVAVYDEPMGPWSLAPTYRGPIAPGLLMDIDAAAATAIVPSRAGEGNRYLLYEMTAAAHVIAPKGRALVIGSGGGRDVLAALLAGARQVDAVEINPIIVNDVMRGRFRAISGGLYDDRRVSVHVGDGRSFVRRSRDRYDLLQLSLVDTWAATAAGAFALSENNLYTREAVEEYVQHLTPDGVLTLTRWAGGETYRLVILVEAAARALAISDPARHVAVIQHRAAPGGENVATTLLFRRSAFDEATAARLRDHVAACGFVWLHDPLLELPGRTSQIARATDPLAEARRTEQYELTPSSDDRPFFFYRPRPFLAGLLEAPSRLFVEGQYLVAFVLAFSAALGVAFILLPLWRSGGGALRAAARPALEVVPYFVALGLGFMLVEVSLMQRFVLYLGHPTHALTAVLAGVLVGAGLGSALAGRLGAPAPAAFAVVAVILLVGVAQPPVFAATQGASLAAKLVLSEALVLPLGAALGTLMPLGIARLTREGPVLIAWAWGLNGLASVVGACAGALASMSFGFAATYRLGALCYVVAGVSAWRWRSGSPGSEAGHGP